MDNTTVGILGGVGLMWVLIVLALAGFWLWMLIDVLANQPEDKLVWLLVVFFGSIFGAAIYFVIARKKRLKAAAAVGS